MTRVISFLFLATLMGCGGGSSREASTPSRAYSGGAYMGGSSYGPISNACISSDRKARSPQLCSCIQAAANSKLTVSEQHRAAAFFSNPDLAQQTRQSSRASDERFWRTYKDYVSLAQAMCS